MDKNTSISVINEDTGIYVNYYCSNECKRIRQLTDYILQQKFGWIPKKDYDDYYSIACQVVWKCERNFNENKKIKFKTYLISCLIKRFKSRITYNNRCKRLCRDRDGKPLPELSLDNIVEEGYDIAVLIDGEREQTQEGFSEGFDIYFRSLTEKQQAIATLIMQGYTPTDVQNILKISKHKYQEQWDKMTSLRKTAILCEERK